MKDLFFKPGPGISYLCPAKKCATVHFCYYDLSRGRSSCLSLDWTLQWSSLVCFQKRWWRIDLIIDKALQAEIAAQLKINYLELRLAQSPRILDYSQKRWKINVSIIFGTLIINKYTKLTDTPLESLRWISQEGISIHLWSVLYISAPLFYPSCNNNGYKRVKSDKSKNCVRNRKPIYIVFVLKPSSKSHIFLQSSK